MLTLSIAAALLGHSLELPTGKAPLLLTFTVRRWARAQSASNMYSTPLYKLECIHAKEYLVSSWKAALSGCITTRLQSGDLEVATGRSQCRIWQACWSQRCHIISPAIAQRRLAGRKQLAATPRFSTLTDTTSVPHVFQHVLHSLLRLLFLIYSGHLSALEEATARTNANV